MLQPPLAQAFPVPIVRLIFEMQTTSFSMALPSLEKFGFRVTGAPPPKPYNLTLSSRLSYTFAFE
jgi:hypothetical protein